MYDSIYVETPGEVKFTETESRMEAVGVGGRAGELLIEVWEDKESSGDAWW